MLYHDCSNSMSTISSKYHEYSFCMWLSWLLIKLSTNSPLFVLIDMLCNRYGGRQATQLCAPFIPCLYLPLSEWNKIYVMLCYVSIYLFIYYIFRFVSATVRMHSVVFFFSTWCILLHFVSFLQVRLFFYFFFFHLFEWEFRIWTVLRP